MFGRSTWPCRAKYSDSQGMPPCASNPFHPTHPLSSILPSPPLLPTPSSTPPLPGSVILRSTAMHGMITTRPSPPQPSPSLPPASLPSSTRHVFARPACSKKLRRRVDRAPARQGRSVTPHPRRFCRCLLPGFGRYRPRRRASRLVRRKLSGTWRRRWRPFLGRRKRPIITTAVVPLYGPSWGTYTGTVAATCIIKGPVQVL